MLSEMVSASKARAASIAPEVRGAAERATRGRQRHRLRNALTGSPPAVIAEIKRRSPSAGTLREGFSPLTLARAYERAGAAAISVLTEPAFFSGSLDDLRDVAAGCAVPVLRKDFIVAEAQVYESVAAGAAAVLLITRILDDAQLRSFSQLAGELGVDALVEVHGREELERAYRAGATLIGVNSRNLDTLRTSLDVARALAPGRLHREVFVAESGIQTAEQISELAALGYRGFLIGEALMRADDPASALAALRERCRV